MRTRTVLLAAVAAVLMLAGCGNGSSPEAGGAGTIEGPPESATPTPTPAPSPPPVTTPAELADYILEGHNVNPTPFADGAGRISFRTPSHNIVCSANTYTGGSVTCFVLQNIWPGVPTQTCEDGDFTDNTVTASAADVHRGNCYSEQPFSFEGPDLGYGDTVSNGNVACRSELWGLSCTHLASKNGFMVAREFYRPYQAQAL